MVETVRNERRINGTAVKCIRGLKGITQDKLATDADIHFAYLSNIERGKRDPSLEVIARIANALEVDVNAISYMSTVYVVDAEAVA